MPAKTGNKWFETQDQIAYYAEFEKEKIVWTSVVETYYCFVDSGYLVLDTSYFTTSLAKWQIGILNSKLIIQYIINMDTLVILSLIDIINIISKNPFHNVF